MVYALLAVVCEIKANLSDFGSGQHKQFFFPNGTNSPFLVVVCWPPQRRRSYIETLHSSVTFELSSVLCYRYQHSFTSLSQVVTSNIRLTPCALQRNKSINFVITPVLNLTSTTMNLGAMFMCEQVCSGALR